MFVSKAGAYPSEALFRCSTLGQAPGLTHKHTWLERPAREKHSSLLRTSENYICKKFYNIGPWLFGFFGRFVAPVEGVDLLDEVKFPDDEHHGHGEYH